MKSISAASKKEQEERKRAIEFQKEKEIILKVVGGVLAHPDLPKALASFLAGHETSIAFLAARAGVFDAARAGTKLATAYVSLKARMDGKKGEYDSKQPPFLLQLLRDRDTLKLVRGHTTTLAALLDYEKIASSIVPYVFKLLKKNPLIKALEAQGLGEKYINTHLRPVVITAIKELLTDPERLLKIAGLVLEMELTKDPKKKALIAKEIVAAIYTNAIIRALQPLGSVLVEQASNLSKLAATVLSQTGVLDKIASKIAPELAEGVAPVPTKVSPELAEGVATVLVPLAGAALSAPQDVLASIAAQLQAIALDDTHDRIRAAGSLAEIAKLEAASGKKITDLVKSVLTLLAQPDVLAQLAATAPGFLAAHGDTLNAIRAQVLPKVLAKLRKDAETLASSCQPGLDRRAIASIVIPIPVVALAPFDASFFDSVFPTVVDVVTVALARHEVAQQAREALAKPNDPSFAALFATAASIWTDPKTKAAVTTTLPALLLANADAVTRSIMSIVNAGTAPSLPGGAARAAADAALRKPKPPLLTRELVGSLIPFVAALLTQLHALAEVCLKDPTSLTPVVQAAVSIMQAPEDSQSKMVPGLINKIFGLASNSELRQILATELPKILEAHSEALTKVIDGLIKNTEVGKDLNVQVGMFIAVAAKKAPELVVVAQAYGERRYGTMIASALKIIFSDRKVLAECVRIAATILAHKTCELVLRRDTPKPGPASIGHSSEATSR